MAIRVPCRAKTLVSSSFSNKFYGVWSQRCLFLFNCLPLLQSEEEEEKTHKCYIFSTIMYFDDLSKFCGSNLRTRSANISMAKMTTPQLFTFWMYFLHGCSCCVGNNASPVNIITSMKITWVF